MDACSGAIDARAHSSIRGSSGTLTRTERDVHSLTFWHSLSRSLTFSLTYSLTA